MTQPRDITLAHQLIHVYSEYGAALDNGDERARVIVTQHLVAMVEQHGWPGRCIVGAEASAVAIALAEHAEQLYRREWLRLVRLAARAGDVPWSHAARLADCVSIAAGERQRFGTQHVTAKGERRLWPLELAPRVDELRTSTGLDPLSDGQIADAWPCIDGELKAVGECR